VSVRRGEPEDLRVVRELARETAELPTPAVDWARIERRLALTSESAAGPILAATRTSSSPRGLRSRWSWALPFAVAAGVGFAWFTQASRPPAVLPVARRIVSTVHDDGGWTVASALERGDIVDSGEERFHYEIAGVVRFTLEAGTQVEVLAIEHRADQFASLTIELRRGSVHADVTPREHGEAFGVEIGGTRVAVHGTSFSVARDSDRAVVDVSHGSVAVGPLGHRGATQGWLVVGPDRASFSLDGAKDVRWLSSEPVVRPSEPLGRGAAEAPARAAALATGGKPHRVPRDPPATAALPVPMASSVAPPKGAAPNRQAVESAETAAILDKLRACHAKQAGSLGMRSSVDSTLTLSIHPSGIVRQGVFDPPLSPPLMRCASDAITEARFVAGNEPTELRLPVHLSRD
jgi:ferric-dicitrate binding protein FerR (iron transport regulator)